MSAWFLDSELSTCIISVDVQKLYSYIMHIYCNLSSQHCTTFLGDVVEDFIQLVMFNICHERNEI